MSASVSGAYASAHLPECDLAKQCRNNVSHDDSGYGDCLHCGQVCECDRLRACEQRVLTEQTTKRNSPGGWMDYGYAAGVQAARDAVAAFGGKSNDRDGPLMYVWEALAAIDALRGES